MNGGKCCEERQRHGIQVTRQRWRLVIREEVCRESQKYEKLGTKHERKIGKESFDPKYASERRIFKSIFGFP